MSDGAHQEHLANLRLNMNKFPIKTVVRVNGNPTEIGEVVEVIDEYQVRVKWNFGETLDTDSDELIIFDPEADQAALKFAQAKIDEAASAFENAFKAYQESRNLLDEDFYYYQRRKMLDLSKLDKVIEVHGWSSSSLYC